MLHKIPEVGINFLEYTYTFTKYSLWVNGDPKYCSLTIVWCKYPFKY